MKKYIDEEICKAIILRNTKKYSFSYLQQVTGIPATTLKSWCKDQPIISKSTALLLNNERRRDELKQSELSALSAVKDINSPIAKILVSLLYWCEGAKYPASNALIFVNSDPTLIKTFITLLRKAFVLDESKFSIRLQIHTTHDYEKLKKYWSKLINVPEARFMKPTVTEKRNGKHRANYQGTCSLKYQDFRLQLKLIGIYENLARLKLE